MRRGEGRVQSVCMLLLGEGAVHTHHLFIVLEVFVIAGYANDLFGVCVCCVVCLGVCH